MEINGNKERDEKYAEAFNKKDIKEGEQVVIYASVLRDRQMIESLGKKAG